MVVGLYVRVSTQEQAQNGSSIEEQEARLRAYAASMGWTVRDVYIDPGFSGATLDRPRLQAMISDIKAGKIQKVVVYKLDRLSRSQKNTLTLIEDVFLKNGVDFVSMCENFDTASPFGRAMIGILAVFAQLEREQIKERMQMGMDARAKAGLFCGSHDIPVGFQYDRERGVLVTDEYEAMQVRKLYELLISGVPVRRIAISMNESGFRHKYGEWSDTTVRNVLLSRYNVGEVKRSGTWHPGLHEPLIDEKTFDAAQGILARNREAYFANNRPGKVTSYLGGLLYCARCGARFVKSNNRQGNAVRSYYYCASKLNVRKMVKDRSCTNTGWRMETLDDLVFAEIRKLAAEPDMIAEPTQTDDAPTIRAQIAEIDRKIAKLVDLYSVDGIPLAALQRRVEAMNEERVELQGQLEKTAQARQRSRDDLVAEAATLDAVLRDGTFDEIRAVITSLIQRIELDGKSVRIFWRL